MLLYTDIFTSDELVSDAFPISDFKDVLLEVQGKMITIGTAEVNIGANASAEEADEGVDDQARQVVNVIESGRLTETGYDKKSYMGYIKAYMKRVKTELEKSNPARVDAFQKGAQEAVKDILGRFDDFRFFMGESCDAEAHIALMFYKGEDPNPFFYFWKDGMKGTKI